jgi:hypothetical protein
LVVCLILLLGGFPVWFLSRISRQTPNKRAAGYFHDQVIPRMTVHPFAKATLAVPGDEPRLIKLGDKVVVIVIGLENHVTPTAAVAAAWAAFGPVFFPGECYRAFAAVACPGVNFDFIDKHWKKKKGEAKASP